MPTMTGSRPRAAWTAARTRRSLSSSDSNGPSPVEPRISSPCTPAATWKSTSVSTDASSTWPSAPSGVMSAGTMPRSTAGGMASPGEMVTRSPPQNLSDTVSSDRRRAQALFVDLDAQPGRCRDVKTAIAQAQRGDQLLRHARVLGGVELEHGHVHTWDPRGLRKQGGDVQRRRVHDRAVPRMRRALDAGQARQVGHEQGLADAAADADVRLDDVDRASIDQMLECGA